MQKLVIIGDSWSCGEWKLHDSHGLKLNHPGLTEYLPYKTINLSKGGASNWQTLFTMYHYMNTRQFIENDYCIILFQTDPLRRAQAGKFDVDRDSAIIETESLTNLYTELTEIFYMKISELAKLFNVKVFVIGGLSDIDKSLFCMYNSEKHIICDSWIKLLYDKHQNSIIPLQFNDELFEDAKRLGRFDLCDQILEFNDKTFVEFTEVIGLDTFGPSLGDFHPSREGHQLLAQVIINFIEKK